MGCYGGRLPSCSPALDRMAAEGLRFTDAYSNSPVCSPTRFDLMSERAVQYVEKQDGKPFFLSLHYTAPHWPWETRHDEAESARIAAGIPGGIAHLDGGSVETYRKMVGHMDEGIGTLLDALAG